ncbi:MAG: OmpA family protein [Myxococcota bacterium]
MLRLDVLALVALVMGCGGSDAPAPVTPAAMTAAPVPPPPADAVATPVTAPRPAPPPNDRVPLRADDRGVVVLPDAIRFETGTDTLLAASDDVLALVRAYLVDNPEVTKIRIEGHTDGDAERNFELSKRRAMAVVGWLVAQGIDCKRLVPVGFGEAKLRVVPDDTPEAKAKNRRVLFIHAEVDGRPVGGLPIDGGEPGQWAGDPCG